MTSERMESTNMKILLPLNTLYGWETVDAEIVDVAPHLAATFALHRGEVVHRLRWAVSDVESGNSIADGVTKELALSRARAKLADKTQRSIESAWRKASTVKTYAFGRGDVAH